MYSMCSSAPYLLKWVLQRIFTELAPRLILSISLVVHGMSYVLCVNFLSFPFAIVKSQIDPFQNDSVGEKYERTLSRINNFGSEMVEKLVVESSQTIVDTWHETPDTWFFLGFSCCCNFLFCYVMVQNKKYVTILCKKNKF